MMLVFQTLRVALALIVASLLVASVASEIALLLVLIARALPLPPLWLLLLFA